MASERTIPILPCRLLSEVLPFYEALEFDVTYRQARPNPYAVVRLNDIELHFCEPPDFSPERSYGSVIIVVPDADALYESFAARLRSAYGKLPSSGIPRIHRPRKKLGTVAGFSVVDPGGNWLRVYRSGDREDSTEKPRGLALALLSAARLGDAKGDDVAAAKLLDERLARYADVPPNERLPALVYRAELAMRMGDPARARAMLGEIWDLPLDDEARAAMTADLETAEEIERDLS